MKPTEEPFFAGIAVLVDQDSQLVNRRPALDNRISPVDHRLFQRVKLWKSE